MIDFNDVSIHFGTQDVLRGASFRVNAGERVGLVGPNGSGKSTIFHLINGEMSTAGGTVSLEGKPRIGHLHQQLHPYDEHDSLLAYAMRAMPRLEFLEQAILDIEEQLTDSSIVHRPSSVDKDRLLKQLGEYQTEFEHLGGYDIETRVKMALGGLGFKETDFARKFTEFSGGWQMRAELVRTLVMQPDILLLDEPSNYLDLPAVEWIQRFLNDYQGTLMLISHDRYLLRSLCTTILEIDAFTITRYNGGLDFYLRERQQRYKTLLAAKENQDRLRDQIQRFIDTFRYTASKAAQVQSRVKQLEKLEEIVVPRQASEAGYLRLPEVKVRAGECVLRLDGAGFSYDDANWVFRNVSFDVGRGDRIALVGYNGMGKTTLSRLLAGWRTPTEGKVVFGYNVTPGYVSQEFAETIPADQSLFRVLKNADDRMTDNDVRTLLGSFSFSGDDAFKPCGVLSGGEKIRLAFARLYAQRPNLLILDEPTTHLDLNGRRALETALQSYDGTLVVVSHDVEFVRAVATRIIAIDPDGVRPFNGNYDDYKSSIRLTSTRVDSHRLESKPSTPVDLNRLKSTKVESDRRSSRDLRKERAEERAKKYPRTGDLKRRIAAAEERITALETEQAQLTETLSANADGTDFAAINRRLAIIQTELATVNTLWEQAASELQILEAD
ncbi:MAG: ABC-F family ATP-binding cassette domain-containing protein [Kiritimatiellaeota bacterium]|nr:ABC-F family ATP-binding cassette domain-containing protein [Kiritimatiellota bacterium]